MVLNHQLLKKGQGTSVWCWPWPQGWGQGWPNCVICCIFTKSSFWLHSYFDILHTSDLFLTQLCTCLNLSLLFIFLLIFLFVLRSSHQLCSVIFRPPFVLLFDHSLYLGTVSSFFVFTCEYLLHVIFSVPCYILPFPSLTVSCDISCVWFYSYLHCYDYSVWVWLHI